MLPALLSRLTAPDDRVAAPVTVRPSKPDQLRPSKLAVPAKLLPVSPSVRVTLSSKRVEPPALLETMPEAPPTVLMKRTAPVEARVIAAPVPSPIGVTLPTAALKLVAPVASSVRSIAPSVLFTVSVLPAVVVCKVTPLPATPCRVRVSVTASPRVTLFAAVKVTAPAVVSITTLPLSVVAVSPAAMVTFFLKVTAPAAPAWVMPLAVASVSLKLVTPVELRVSAAPTPSPIGVTLPTAALNDTLTDPTVARSKPPLTVPDKVKAPEPPILLPEANVIFPSNEAVPVPVREPAAPTPVPFSVTSSAPIATPLMFSVAPLVTEVPAAVVPNAAA